MIIVYFLLIGKNNYLLLYFNKFNIVQEPISGTHGAKNKKYHPFYFYHI